MFFAAPEFVASAHSGLGAGRRLDVSESAGPPNCWRRPAAKAACCRRPGSPRRQCATGLLLFLMLCVAGPATRLGAGTTVRYVEVSAPQDWVLSGNTLQLEARALNSYGARLAGLALQWSSNNTSVAAVDAAGRVRGLLPGRAEIVVSSSGVSGRFAVSVHPARIEIEPGRLELLAGEQLSLTARAFDAEGRPLSGAGFLWFSGLPGVAPVSPQGVVQALTEGSTTVTAYLNVPALGFAFSAQTLVRVRGRPAFFVERLITNEFETSPVSLNTIGQVSYAGNDRIAFQAALSNGSQALMLHDNGVLNTLAVSGQYLDAAAAIVANIYNVSVNARGDVLAQLNFLSDPGNAPVLYVNGESSLAPRVISAPGGYCCSQTDFHGLGEDGEMAFTAYNETGANVFFRGKDGSLQLLATQNDDLPGFGVADWLGGGAIYRPGEVVFQANRSDGQGYFHWDGQQIRKIYASGDSVLDRNVHGGEPPIQTASGEFYAHMYGDGFDQIARLSGGSWSKVIQSGERLGGFEIHGVHQLFDVRGDAVLLAASTDQGSGAFLWQGGSLTFVARNGDSPGEWRWISQAFFRPQGGAVIAGNQGPTLWRVAQVDGSTETTIAQSGHSLSQPAPTSLDWRNLVVGGATGNYVLSSSSGALLRVGKDSLESLLAPGDSLPGGRVVGPASNSGGDLAVAAETDQGPSLYLWRDGGFQVVAARDAVTPPGGGELHWFHPPLAVNGLGQIAAWTGFDQGQGLLLYSQGATVTQSLMISGEAAPGGGDYQQADQVALDGTGRALFQARLSSGASALFFWENGQARKILQIGDEGPRGEAVTQFRGPIAASADKFYAMLGYGMYGETTEIVEYDGQRFRSIVSSGEPASFGSFIEYFSQDQFAVSSNGEIAYLAGLRGAEAVVVRKRDGRDVIVASTAERSPQGDWFLGFRDVHLTGQGEVIFTGLSPTTLKERIGLYAARRN